MVEMKESCGSRADMTLLYITVRYCVLLRILHVAACFCPQNWLL